MPTTVIASVGSRASNAVTVNTVTSTTVTGYTNAWSVVLAAAVPATTVVGDKLTTGTDNYLITGVSGSTLTVVGDAGIAFTSTATPSTGSATTTRAYSAPQLWSAGSPASLVTKDWIWRGEVYKEGNGGNGEWILGSAFSDVNVSFNSTADATRYYYMTAAAGQSFRDNPNKLTNALRPNGANGVLIYLAGNYSSFLGGGKTIFYGLQLGAVNQVSFWGAGGPGEPIFDSCIVYSSNGGVFNARVVLYNSLTQKLGIQNGGGYNILVASTMIGNAGGFGNTTGGNITIRNCAIFNYTSFGPGVNASVSTNNVTDLASLGYTGTGNLLSRTYANQFQSITAGSEDFRVKSGADLIGVGVRDQAITNDVDIVGTARSTMASPYGPTVGAWEFPIIFSYARPSSDITAQWTSSTAGAPNYAMIDETTFDDNDYINATAASQTSEVGVQPMAVPKAGTNLLINYRVQGVAGSSTVTVSLYCGATLIKTDTTRNANNTTPDYYTMTVTSAEWASVTDWSNMRLRFVSG